MGRWCCTFISPISLSPVLLALPSSFLVFGENCRDFGAQLFGLTLLVGQSGGELLEAVLKWASRVTFILPKVSAVFWQHTHASLAHLVRLRVRRIMASRLLLLLLIEDESALGLAQLLLLVFSIFICEIQTWTNTTLPSWPLRGYPRLACTSRVPTSHPYSLQTATSAIRPSVPRWADGRQTVASASTHCLHLQEETSTQSCCPGRGVFRRDDDEMAIQQHSNNCSPSLSPSRRHSAQQHNDNNCSLSRSPSTRHSTQQHNNNCSPRLS